MIWLLKPRKMAFLTTYLIFCSCYPLLDFGQAYSVNGSHHGHEGLV